MTSYIGWGQSVHFKLWMTQPFILSSMISKYDQLFWVDCNFAIWTKHHAYTFTAETTSNFQNSIDKFGNNYQITGKYLKNKLNHSIQSVILLKIFQQYHGHLYTGLKHIHVSMYSHSDKLNSGKMHLPNKVDIGEWPNICHTEKGPTFCQTKRTNVCWTNLVSDKKDKCLSLKGPTFSQIKRTNICHKKDQPSVRQKGQMSIIKRTTLLSDRKDNVCHKNDQPSVRLKTKNISRPTLCQLKNQH